jgi:hypothetical protein
MTAVGPVNHITRALLPWRTSADLTECGKSVAALGERLVTRDEAFALIAKIGQKRAAFEMCMTCVEVSNRRNRFDPADAVAVVAREFAAAAQSHPPYAGDEPSKGWQARQRFNGELEAIGALIAAHRDEFDGYLASRAATVSLADRRRQRRR